METAVYQQPALILHHRPYRESSLILDVFTRDFGIISLLAKGVRKQKSKTAGLLLPFIVLNISYVGKNQLKTLTQIDYVQSFSLIGLSWYCGFYINELLQRFLHKADPAPDLFFRYQHCLHALATSDALEPVLRYFELDLLEEAGYGISLDVDALTTSPINPDLRYHFWPEQGMIADNNGLVSGNTLLLLAQQAQLTGSALTEAKHLLRVILDVYLQGRPLKSRAVLANINQYR